MTPINPPTPSPVLKKKKLLRDANGNVIKRKKPTDSTLVRRPLRRLKRITLPSIVEPPPEPPKPKVLVGHTPIDLVEIWENKIPWLKSIVKMPPTTSGGINYSVLNPGFWCDFNAVKATGPSSTAIEWKHRLIGKAVSNQYFFTNTRSVYPDSESQLSASTPISFADMEVTKVNLPIKDLRTKLFMLLAGMYEIEFGYDPEFFALKPEEMPTNFPNFKSTTSGWTKDGLAWEAHTNEPARCLNNLLTFWQTATHGKVYPGYESSYNPKRIHMSCAPKLEITSGIAATLTPAQLELGCNPSLNIYGLSGDLGLASMLPARWAGGHVHIALPKCHVNPDTIKRCIRNVDAIAGVALVNMVGDWDDTQRRQFYGQAGEYREKKYGFEYRTPSNQMWTSSYLLYSFLEVMRMAVKMALAGLDYEDIGFDTTEEEIIRTIQDNNKAMALAIIERNLPIYSAIFEAKSNFSRGSFGPLSAVLREEQCKSLRRDTADITSESLQAVFGDRKQLNYLPSTWPSKYAWAKIS